MRRHIFGSLVFSFFLFLPSQANANIGLPMIFVSYPIMLAALIPIILFEGYLSAKILKLQFKKSVVPSSLANCVSTILGFPLAWLLLLWFQASATGGGCGPGFDTTFESVITVIVEAAWLCSWEQQLWMIPVAFVVCLLVAFFLSLLIEFPILIIAYKDQDKATVWKATFIANASSYMILIPLSSIYLFMVSYL